MEGHVFTPKLHGERGQMVLSDTDNAKIKRGRGWTAKVQDLISGKMYKIRGAPCGCPDCFCDAVAVEVTN